jgi:hypothetical protein
LRLAAEGCPKAFLESGYAIDELKAAGVTP